MNSPQAIEDAANRSHYRTLTALRGVAFVGQVGAVFLSYYGLNIVLPVATMVIVASVLVVFNLYGFYRLRQAWPIGVWDLFAGLSIDVLVLTVQLHLSNGAYNPLVSFYMLPVIAGALMLTSRLAWTLYGLTILCYLALVAFAPSMPTDMHMGHMGHTEPMAHAAPAQADALIDRSSLHMGGMMVGYFLCGGCVVAIVLRIRRDLALREAELQASRARALEQDHILRTGLLAAGAAHELGTPLTTLSVILGDWLSLSPPRKKADRDADLATMAAQVERCKAIISDILTASGQARGEGASLTTVGAFVRQTATRWSALHKADLSTDFHGESATIIADRILEQALFNLLDNALEASRANGRDEVRFSSHIEDGSLVLSVADAGTGFDTAILAAPGRPFQSTKATSGRGLGLFLVKTTAQSLGGDLKVNSSDAGSTLNLILPLSALEARPNG